MGLVDIDKVIANLDNAKSLDHISAEYLENVKKIIEKNKAGE